MRKVRKMGRNDFYFEDRFGLTSLNELEILKNVY